MPTHQALYRVREQFKVENMTTDQTNNRLQWDWTADPEWMIKSWEKSGKLDAATCTKIAVLCAARVAHLAASPKEAWEALTMAVAYVEKPDDVNKFLCDYAYEKCQKAHAALPQISETFKACDAKNALLTCLHCATVPGQSVDGLLNVFDRAQLCSKSHPEREAQCAIIRSIIPNPFA